MQSIYPNLTKLVCDVNYYFNFSKIDIGCTAFRRRYSNVTGNSNAYCQYNLRNLIKTVRFCLHTDRSTLVNIIHNAHHTVLNIQLIKLPVTYKSVSIGLLAWTINQKFKKPLLKRSPCESYMLISFHFN